MTKIAINTTAGGYNISADCTARYLERSGRTGEFTAEEMEYLGSHLERNDPLLIEIIEEMGLEAAAGEYCGDLKIVEIPDDVKWYIYECDMGTETIHEEHRFWS